MTSENMREVSALSWESVRAAVTAVVEAARAFLDWLHDVRQALAAALEAGAVLAQPAAPWHRESRPPRLIKPRCGWQMGPLGRPAYRPRC